MSRQIDLQDIKPADLPYLQQRPWLLNEARAKGFHIPSGDEPDEITPEDVRDLTEQEEIVSGPPLGEEGDDDYDMWKVPELREELKARQLDSQGTKEELVNRLREDDDTEE